MHTCMSKEAKKFMIFSVYHWGGGHNFQFVNCMYYREREETTVVNLNKT